MNEKIEKIIANLTENGYEVEYQEVTKNNTIKKGIVFREHDPSPVIYIDNLLDVSLEVAVNEIIKVYENSTFNSEIDFDEMMTKEFIEKNVRIALQQTSEESNIVKKETEFEGIEQYLRVYVANEYSFKITKQLLTQLELDEEELWHHAKENTIKNTTVVSMSKIFAAAGISVPNTDMEMWVLKNADGAEYGASALLNTELINNIKEKYNYEKMIVFPSSIHEVILIPYDEDNENFNEMIREINETQLTPEEVLSNQFYIV